MITILYRDNPQTYFNALYPIFASKHYKYFKLATNAEELLKKDSNKIIIILNFFKSRYEKIEENILLLKQLKQKYEKVIFFDDSDGADSLRTELIEFVDLYFKKQLLIDRAAYLNFSYGRQFFSNYYYENFGITDEQPSIREKLDNQQDLQKLRLAWNIGVGIYPTPKIKQKLAKMTLLKLVTPDQKFLYPIKRPKVLFKKHNILKIQARFSEGAYPKSIGFQRKLFLDKVSHSTKFSLGRLPRKDYNLELSEILGVLSPFGFGEICHRDFEAFYYGNVLLKPNMEHIETYPNVFLANETYVPIKWDASNVIEKATEVIENPTFSQAMALKGQSNYYDNLSKLEKKVEDFINEILK